MIIAAFYCVTSDRPFGKIVPVIVSDRLSTNCSISYTIGYVKQLQKYMTPNPEIKTTDILVSVNTKEFDEFLDMTSYQRSLITKRFGVDQGVWSKWANGKRSPSLAKIQQIAPVFGLNTGEMALAIEALQKQKRIQKQRQNKVYGFKNSLARSK